MHARMHAKSLQSCPTLCNTMGCNLPGSSVHRDSPGKNTGVGCHALLQGIFLTQGLNLGLLCLLHWQAGSLPLALDSITSLVAQMVKNLPAMRETWVRSLDWEDSLEEGMETHSSILAWRIPMDRGAWRATVHRVTKSWT